MVVDNGVVKHFNREDKINDVIKSSAKTALSQI